MEARKTRATPGVERSVRTMRAGAWRRWRAPTMDSASAESCVRLRGAMIRSRFGRDDLLRTRFAVSPLFEVVWSAHVLRRPARAPLHRPWVATARARLAGLDFAMLDWLA